MDSTASPSAMFAAPLWSSEEQHQPLLKKQSRLSILRKRYRTTRKCFGSPAILTLLGISFLCHMLYYFFSSPTHLFPGYFYSPERFDKPRFPEVYKNLAKSTCTAALYLLFPFAGYLADTRLGHYRIILYSTRIQVPALGLTLVGGGIVVAMKYFAPERNIAHIFVEVGGYITLSVGLLLVLLTVVGIGANIVIFGLDQFFDTPWDDQVVYILWYMWTSFTARMIVAALGNIHRHYHPDIIIIYYSAAGGTYLVVLLAVLLLHCLLFRRKDWFITNYHRSRDNPYRIVYKVTKYARQNKMLVNKEAFSDCNREIPSGYDVCMQKYGGPFSSTLVEDVKSFYSIVKILAIGCTFFYFVHISYGDNDMFEKHLSPKAELKETLNSTMVENMMKHFRKLPIVVFLPVYIIAIRPLVLPHIPKMLRKIGINLTMSLIPILVMFILETVLYSKYQHLHCMFTEHQAVNHSLPYNIPEALVKSFHIYNLIIHLCSDFLVVAVYAALYKFICSQSPHSMKGFLVGLTFALTGFYELAVNVVALAVSCIGKGKIHRRCGLIYFTFNMVVGMAALLLYVWTARKYRYRRVRDVDDNMEPPRSACGGGLLGCGGGRCHVRHILK